MCLRNRAPPFLVSPGSSSSDWFCMFEVCKFSLNLWFRCTRCPWFRDRFQDSAGRLESEIPQDECSSQILAGSSDGRRFCSGMETPSKTLKKKVPAWLLQDSCLHGQSSLHSENGAYMTAALAAPFSPNPASPETLR